MNLFRIVFELFALYLLYKLIFDFIIPITKTTKEVKKKFSEMSAQMEEKMNQQTNTPPNAQFTSSTATGKKDDYIEFEEVK